MSVGDGGGDDGGGTSGPPIGPVDTQVPRGPGAGVVGSQHQSEEETKCLGELLPTLSKFPVWERDDESPQER